MSNAESQIIPAINAEKRPRFSRKAIFGIVFFMAVVAGLLGFKAYNLYRFHLEKEMRVLMDTYVTIYAIGPEKITSKAVGLAFDRMQEVELKFNIHNSKSPLYAFNHFGTTVSDPEILHVVSFALQICNETDGAFDITISPLSDLWGFYSESPRLPSKEEIGECLTKIGYKHVLVNNNKLEKDRDDIRIDLGALAKGYSVFQAAEVLKANGVKSALIDAGGDIYALGKKGGKLWKVGVRSPRKEDLQGYFEIEDLAVMGSGDYERFFIKDGKRYHHIMNPKTGYPAQGLSGITLIHPDPMTADAWATAVFVLGPEKGLEMVEKKKDMEVLMVTDSGEKILSSGLKDQLLQIPQSD